ncbi:MAG: DUF4345 family protein [Chloroflexota bacterium]
MKTLAKVLSGILTLVFVGLGLLFMFNPAATLELIQLTPEAAGGWAGIRSVFGGLFLGLAVLLLRGLMYEEWLPIRIAGIILAITILGRIISLVADGFETNLLGPIIVEIVLVAISLFSARQFEKTKA